MAEEPRQMDPTRRMLRVFGVKLTDYEERTAALLNADAVSEKELLRLAGEAVALTVDMNEQLRTVTAHVLETQARVLAEVRSAIQKAQSA